MKNIFVLIVFHLCSIQLLNAQRVLSLHSLFFEEDAVLISRIEGTWSIPEMDFTFSLEKAGDNFYFLEYENDNRKSKFEATFVNINDVFFLNLKGVLPDTLGDSDYRNSFVSSHSFYKIVLKNNTLLLYEPNYEWFYNYAIKDQNSLKNEWVNNDMLLTYKTAELKLFLSEHFHESGFFISPTPILKIKDVKAQKNVVSDSMVQVSSKSLFTQGCTPMFPLKDGWLGGDGNVSVPLNDTTTLFLFSDSFVGKKNQNRQEPGWTMISNSVAIQTCVPDGGTNVQYFWNNMFTNNPKPIFKSYTNRYRYWVQDAFLIKGVLHVILMKVGHKSAAAPDEIFNFSKLGVSMARITNPYDIPTAWEITLFPMNIFSSPDMEYSCHAIQNDYIYFFINRNDSGQYLVRKSIDNLNNFEKPYEYYALDKTWKAGIKKDDLYEIAHGFRCNTVKYHPNLGLWVMICDIKFMDNKLKMRTSELLTGLWSDEITIYDIPEVTPGSSSYNKTNFCYAARECIQNYDSINQVMTITYDINNSDLLEVLANPKIYTPKVIKVPIKKFVGKNN